MTCWTWWPRCCPTAGLLAGAHVWVDGFIGFTPQELAVVRAIWRVARRMDVVLCLDPSGEAEPFAPTRETYERLRNMAAEDGVEVEAPVVLDAQPPPRFRNSPLLAHLERELFRRPGQARFTSRRTIPTTKPRKTAGRR